MITSDLEAPVEQECETCAQQSSSRSRRNSSVRYARESIARIIIKDKNEKEKVHNEQRRSSFSGKNILSPNDFSIGPTTHFPLNEDEDFHEILWQRQENEKSNLPWYIFLQNGKARLSWDALMAIILCVMAFYIPYRVCFFWQQDNYEEHSIFIFESVIDAVFVVDIVFNFFTTYTDAKTSMIVASPKQIALHYLRGYFFIDLIATIPFGYILTSSSFAVTNKVGKLGRLPKLVKFVRAARMLKLLRVYRLHDFVLKLEVKFNVNHGYSRMIKIVTMILLVTHMVGCFWFLIGITGGEEGEEGEQGWVYRYNLASSPRSVQYIAAMYWSFSTLTTVGYGDISARTPQEQTYSMVMMLIGVTWYAFIVSSMSSIMSSFDAQNKALREKMMCVNEFIRTTKLPKALSKQVRDFFDFKARSQHAYMSSNYDVDELLGEMGSGLRADILLHLERKLIEKIPFLQGKVPQFVADCVSMFSPMVFNEGDFIVKEGSQADEMYFLVKGKAGVFYGSKLVAVVTEGSYFGEIACIMGGIRRAGVKALRSCELQALSKRNLNILLAEYPAVADELRTVACDRAKIASQCIGSNSSSEPSEMYIDRIVESVSTELRKEMTS